MKTDDALPMVSILMPAFNQERFIDSAIESVLDQNYYRLELIVADAGSSDDTPSRLAAWQQRDPRVRHFSGRASGVSDALNKAFGETRGTLIGRLGAEDVYTPGAIQRAASALASDPGLMYVYGRAEKIDERGLSTGNLPVIVPPTPAQQFLNGCFVPPSTVFFKRTAGVLLGLLDRSLNVAFDFEYSLRLFKRIPERVGFVDAVQAQCRLPRDFSAPPSDVSAALEAVQVLHRHLGYVPLAWLEPCAAGLLNGVDAPDKRQTALQSLLQEVKPFLTRMQGEELAARWGLGGT